MTTRALGVATTDRRQGDEDRWHSVSSVRTYETCPRKYRFAYVERAPTSLRVPDRWRVGTAVHDALAAVYEARRSAGGSGLLVDLAADARAALGESWAAEGLPLDDGGLERACRILDGVLASESPRPDDLLGVECRLRATTDDGLELVGYADLILRTGPDSIEIRDHKVSTFAQAPERLETDLQLNLYGAMAREMWPWVRTVTASHHYPPIRRIVRVRLTTMSMDAAVEHVRRVAAKIRADAYLDPTPGPACWSCVWWTGCAVGQAWRAERAADEAITR